ncbi:hypothetical protein M405DRAFT_487199 [Rhizopogon salebrosus TDB-379]|nr:hypothetical protein M405DRAFT_487199 [Rhizopogon salebrosus TDB-379]
MVNWQDPKVIEQCSIGFVDVNLLLLGFYGWYYLQVETALLRRQLAFRWPMVSYVTGRIFFLMSATLAAILGSPFTAYFDCGCLLKFLAFSANIVVACASANLVILTWAIWSSHRPVRLLLAFVTLGHWFILAFDSWGSQIFSSSEYCGYLVVNPTYSAVAATYTMIFDLFLLILAIHGLSRSSSSISLRTTLHNPSVICFFIVFLATVVPLIFSWLNFNYIMNIFFACPGV